MGKESYMYIVLRGDYDALEIEISFPNSTPRDQPIENGMGLIARCIEIARGKVK